MVKRARQRSTARHEGAPLTSGQPASGVIRSILHVANNTSLLLFADEGLLVCQAIVEALRSIRQVHPIGPATAGRVDPVCVCRCPLSVFTAAAAAAAAQLVVLTASCRHPPNLPDNQLSQFLPQASGFASFLSFLHSKSLVQLFNPNPPSLKLR